MDMTPTKTTRSQEIARCFAIVAKEYDVSPFDIQTKSLACRGAIQECRRLLAYHLHDCGMSYKAIGKLWKAGEESTRENARHAHLFMTGPKVLLLERLPRLTTSVEIVRTEVPPVMESRSA